MTVISTPRLPILVLVLSLTLSACGGSSGHDALPAGLPIVETVNGQPVPQVLLDVLARERKLDLDVPEQRAAALTELRDYILLGQAAEAGSYFDDPLFAAEVEINRLQGMANATLGKFRSSAQVDDSVLRTEYEQQLAKAGSSEYDFSQLLFDNEDDALKAAGEAMNQPFSEVFDAWSTRAKQARAFQRVRPVQLPEPMARALTSMKSGETTKVPVKTDYGWHVIHVGAISPFVPPTFEQLRESIRETLLAQLSQQRLIKLREEAKVTTESPTDAEPSADAVPADKPAN
ncbi:peptidyl-prolyl cis-trans isomerase [Dokdonella sp.]|uniref:peptidylprolyl isomerase n=1 Tax=Dokdonella sp. TaxID=2291710 RepID=UPI003526E8BA